jgi:hypothetical protein
MGTEIVHTENVIEIVLFGVLCAVLCAAAYGLTRLGFWIFAQTRIPNVEIVQRAPGGPVELHPAVFMQKLGTYAPGRLDIALLNWSEGSIGGLRADYRLQFAFKDEVYATRVCRDSGKAYITGSEQQAIYLADRATWRGFRGHPPKGVKTTGVILHPKEHLLARSQNAA